MENEEALKQADSNLKKTKITIDEIRELIKIDEKIDVEFKESKVALNKDVFDTVCSFSNRNGGHIFFLFDFELETRKRGIKILFGFELEMFGFELEKDIIFSHTYIILFISS